MEFKRFDETVEAGKFAELVSAEIENGKLNLRISAPYTELKWKYFVIGYLYKIASDREDYIAEADSVTYNGFEAVLKGSVDIEKFPFKPTNWYVAVAYEEDGQIYAARIILRPKKIGSGELLKGGYSYADKKGYLLFTCGTRGGYLGLRYREKTEYDSRKTKMKEAIAFSLYNAKAQEYIDRKIYLIFEKKCAKAQDNAYYLFKYCMDNDMESYLGRSIYYVITHDSPDRKKLEPYKDHVIIFGSIKHMIYMLASKLLISSDAKAHGYIYQYDRSIIGQRMPNKSLVFLGHGVLALKRLNDSFLASRMNAILTTVTSEMEADIVVNELGFKKHEAVVTGYARFDALQDQSSEHREILIMPTHRSWLFGVDRETFTASEYYRRYMELLNSPELGRMLEENDLTANFYLHPSIMEHFDAFSTDIPRVKMIPYGQYSLDDLMMRCSLLVSDYSSVCWDLYYMGKPTVFYQYDVQEYLDTWGSYIDLEKDTPGNRADSLEQLLGYIRESIDNGFKLDEYWQSRRESTYKFTDKNNCRRICEVLKERNL